MIMASAAAGIVLAVIRLRGWGGELSIDIEFGNEWETASDLNEDDDEAVEEESELCFPAEGEGPMDLS
jgi:hypothetical protein